jgi:hypothetical protein
MEEMAMMYVVEIESRAGARAMKEYEASSAYELNFVVKHELAAYPTFQVVQAWEKGPTNRPVFIAQP